MNESNDRNNREEKDNNMEPLNEREKDQVKSSYNEGEMEKKFSIPCCKLKKSSIDRREIHNECFTYH